LTTLDKCRTDDVPFFGYTMGPPPPRIKRRDQHPSFGKELRALLASKTSEDRELAGIIKDELVALTKAKNLGQRHSKEDSLTDDLRDISYLRLYTAKFSVRIYFTVAKAVLWMLALNTNKRATALSNSMKEILHSRLADIRCESA